MIDAIQRYYRFRLSIRIKSNADRGAAEFEKLAHAALFQLAYNLDLPLVQERVFTELDRAARIKRFRRGRPDEVDPPQRKYDPELVAHYQLALSSENPSLQFLGFYHILEFFFVAVYNENLIDSLRSAMTRPGFSTRRTSDLEKIVSLVKDKLKTNASDFEWSEREALALVIRKYIKPGSLVAELNAYDGNLVSYYTNQGVTFAATRPIAIDEMDAGATADRLAERIYAVRNAIVHSKEGKKPRFRPFHDDKALLKEIPLLRFIAETVIVESASPLS